MPDGPTDAPPDGAVLAEALSPSPPAVGPPGAGASQDPRTALIAPPEALFDRAAMARALADIAGSDESNLGKRVAAAQALSGEMRRGRAAVAAAFDGAARSGLRAARSYAWITDRVVEASYDFVVSHLFCAPTPTAAEKIAVTAVGGYGRAEMAPYSDVDLLFLTPYRQTAWGESVVEAMLYMLWDMRLKVGHATRNVEDCRRLGADDLTIRTALLEKRFICGARELFDDLDETLWRDLFAKTGPEFVEAKLAEREARLKGPYGSRYLLEPNVKESKGGLRDLQTLFWIAKYLYREDAVDGLVDLKLFTAEEAARCRAAEAHLWTVRVALHHLAGRAQDRLTFDAQVELAERFGYRTTAGQRPVERFMKRYFTAAKHVGDLTRIFCAALEHQHKKKPPLLGAMWRLFTPSWGEKRFDVEWIEMRDGRLMVSDPDAYRADPLNMLRLIDIGVRREILLHPAALQLISRHRRALDDVRRAPPELGALFLELLAHSKDPVRVLRRMSETGALQRLLPDFGRVTALMQFNMYHHYTVDEHTIRAVEVYNQIRAGDLRAPHPIETELAQADDDRRVMTMALLLHDIGKGLPKDHSVVGEAIAREVCPSLGMNEAEVDQVAWLVRQHLAMSDVAQKRDISDPATVRDFAHLIRSPKRLKLLYVLTACDIRAVGPGVWTTWKAQLLRGLYQETLALLTGEEAGLSRPQRVAAAQDELRAVLGHWTDAAWEAHLARFFSTYWLGLGMGSLAMHAEMMAGASPDEPLEMRTRKDVSRGATEVAFFTSDHPGLFARMAGAFALAGASVVDARAYTTKDGMAVNTFWVQDDDGAAFERIEDEERLRGQVFRALQGDVVPREALRARRKLRPRERSFTVPPSVVVDNAASDIFTVIEVNGRDRTGLLHDLARAISSENVNIFSAIIATYGEHAVDVFYVKDVFGMKITNSEKQARIRRALLSALACAPSTPLSADGDGA